MMSCNQSTRSDDSNEGSRSSALGIPVRDVTTETSLASTQAAADVHTLQRRETIQGCQNVHKLPESEATVSFSAFELAISNGPDHCEGEYHVRRSQTWRPRSQSGSSFSMEDLKHKQHICMIQAMQPDCGFTEVQEGGREDSFRFGGHDQVNRE